MILSNLHRVITADVFDVSIEGKHIRKVGKNISATSPHAVEFSFDNAMVLPGLINSHDHLDFNLFPQLGNKLYSNYREWAAYIHKNFIDEIAVVLKVPKDLRIQWGIYKNLICGITTVVNHGEKLNVENDVITVLQGCQSLHSVAFEKGLLWQLNNPSNRKKQIAIHVGEGMDAIAAKEIDTLIRWNLFNRNLIGVHGVKMNQTQAKRFKALVWCPASNYFMFNQTTDINLLKEATTICFGSDSTLTSSWNIWKHFKIAQQECGITERDLLEMLTINPARVWGTNGGLVAEGKDANLVIVNNNSSLFNITPEEIKMVIHEGEIRLYDDSLHEELHRKSLIKNDFFPIKIGQSIKYVKGDIHGLIKQIKRYYPGAKLPVKPMHALSVQHD